MGPGTVPGTEDQVFAVYRSQQRSLSVLCLVAIARAESDGHRCPENILVVKSPGDVLLLPCWRGLRCRSVEYGRRSQRKTDKRAEKLIGVRGHAVLVPPAGTDGESSSCGLSETGRSRRDVCGDPGPA